MEDTPKATTSRAYRSRRSRPCDKCRKAKQLCIIAVEGQACGGCNARRQPCTFDLPPVRRLRKSQSKEGTEDLNITGQLGETNAVAGPSTAKMATQRVEIPPRSELSPSSQMYTGGMSAPINSNSLGSQGSPLLRMGEFSGSLAGPTLPALSVSPNAVSNHATANWFDPQTWQTLFQPDTLPMESPQSAPPVSLDLESALGVESHFLGTGTFRGLTLREINTATQSIPNRPGMVEFRQVSADERNPVYFVRHTSLQYGQAPENGRVAWEKVTRTCSHLGRSFISQALLILRQTVIPTLPIINYPQLEQASRTTEGQGPPYALLAAAVAHAASYVPALRPLHQALWSHVLNAMDAEFRQPRLLAIQLVLLLLSSRPGVNFAQSDITLSRAVGAVHVLGLHLDPSQWSLPRWERSLRIRLFWTVLFHDKMRSLLLGRPSHLSSDNYSTPMPTVEDARWDNESARSTLSSDELASMEAFIANCHLVPIIEKLLEGFMTVKAASRPMSYLSRIALLSEIRLDLDNLENSLSPPVRYEAFVNQPRATGVRSLQMCILGLKILVHRIELDTIDHDHAPHVLATVYESALKTASLAVQLVSELTLVDRSMFWMPYTFHHMSNAGSLLLRIASEYRIADPAVSTKAINLAGSYCTTLAQYWQEEQWDMADETLKRLAEPAFTVGKDFREAREVYRIISDALGFQVSESAWDDSVPTSYLGFINDGFDPSVWTVDGMPWINV